MHHSFRAEIHNSQARRSRIWNSLISLRSRHSTLESSLQHVLYGVLLYDPRTKASEWFVHFQACGTVALKAWSNLESSLLPNRLQGWHMQYIPALSLTIRKHYFDMVHITITNLIRDIIAPVDILGVTKMQKSEPIKEFDRAQDPSMTFPCLTS